MLHFSRGKTIAILLTCLYGILMALPNLAPSWFPDEKTTRNWPFFVPHRTVPLGLDLQGGSHLVLALDEQEMKKAWFDDLLDSVRARLRNTVKVPFSGLSLVGEKVQVTIDKPEDVEAALTELRKIPQPTNASGLSGIGGYDVEVKREGQLITLQPTEQGIREKISSGMGAAIETIRRRVDALGTTEPNIVRQGSNRIVVQVPGDKDPARLKELIGKTAKMTFHFVHQTMDAATARKTGIPPGYMIVKSKEGEGEILIERRAIVLGEELQNAYRGTDQFGRPAVDFRFNSSGARKFYDATRNNIGRRFAIKLDDEVISAPEIKSAIPGGSGQISGSFTTESANTLAVQMRSGALPATLTVIEERSVGASLGQDSIEAGKIASYVAFIAVAIFMMVAYGLFGFFSVIALVVKLILIFAIMSMMRATLTLPGIAGIALTIGIAVDANVLIYERIREEIRNGKTPIAAVEAGFTRAIATIVDTQLTALIAALIMFGLGSGPIRGFGITLTIGIFTAVFTAVTLTRLIIATWLRYQRTHGRPIEIPV